MGGVHAVSVNDKKHFFWGTEFLTDEDAFVTAYLELMLKALAEDPLDVLAHPTYLPVPLNHRYDDVWNERRCGELWTAAAERGVAVEISGRWLVPGERQIKLALEAGVTFAVGSDAHRRAELFAVEYPRQMIERLNISEERIFLPQRKKT
jgi:histidinol phosphatase-like PHP family hydrolase